MKVEVESRYGVTHTITPHPAAPILSAFIRDPGLVSVTYAYQNGDSIVHTIIREEENADPDAPSNDCLVIGPE
jgi:hypothetical protein